MSEQIIREYAIGEFRGDFPDIPIDQSVEDGLKELDANPFYAVLPIVPKVGAISNNGLLYDEELVSSLERQVNENKPGGIFGHLKDADRDTSFPLPSGMWVSAKRQGDTLWGRVYLPSGPAREHIRTLKAIGGQIATSIYGKGKFEKVRDGVRRLTNFKLESLDFAPPSRAALGYGAVPHVIAQMSNEPGDDDMTDKAQVIAELTVDEVPAKLREAIIAEATKQDETQSTIAELTNTVKAKDEVIAEMQGVIEQHRVERLNAAIDAKVAEFTNWTVADEEGKAKLAKLRALLRGQIVTRLGDAQTVERVAEISTEAWEDIKPIAEMVRDALAGPAAVVAGRAQNNGAVKPVEDTPENRNRALAQMGINV